MAGVLKRIFSGKQEEGVEVFDVHEIRRLSTSRRWENKWYNSIFLLVDDNGKVVEAKQRVRGKKEKVHLIGLPLIFRFPYTRHLTVELSPHKKGFGVTVDVDLAVEYICEDWDCQQLYDVVVKAGFDHIEDWLKAEFINTALDNSCVLQSFENYKQEQNAFAFFEQLTKALQNLQFEGQQLYCIGKVTAKVEIETAKVQTVAVYD